MSDLITNHCRVLLSKELKAKDAEIERLEKLIEPDYYAVHLELHDAKQEIERLKGDIQILKLQRDATHVSRCPRCAALDTVGEQESK